VIAGTLLVAAGTARAQLDQPLPEPSGAPKPVPKLTKRPEVKVKVEPVYPQEAFAAGIGGDVTMVVDIDAEGHVTNVTVSKSAGHGLDEAAVEATRQTEFTPAEVDDKPSPIRIEMTIHFQPVTIAAPPPAPEPEPPPPEPPPPAAPPPAAPPPVVVRLRMRAKGTRDPVVGADVAIIVGDRKAEVVGATDDDGRFEVRAAAPGGLRVIVSDSAYEPCVRDFTATEVGAPTPPDWTCFARSRSQGVFETRVHGQATHPEETKTTLSKAELTTVPGTLGDPLRVIQNLPGVARSPFGLGVLIVRGANPADTGVFVDTLNIPILYHFLAGPSVLTPNLIDKVDFYPGGFGARYGRFSGGLVDVTLRSEVGRSMHGSADINVLDSSVFVEGPIKGGWRGSVSLRRSYVDQLLPYFVPKKVGSTFVTAVPIYYDYQARVERDTSGGGRLSLEAFGSDDELGVIAQDPTRQLTLNQRTGSHRVLLTWLATAGGWLSRFSPAYGYGVTAVDFGPNGGAISYHRLFVREDLTRSFGSHFTLASGFDGVLSYDLADFNSPFPRDGRTVGVTTPEQIVVTRRLLDEAPGAYVEGQWTPSAALRVVPGVRYDFYRVVGVNKQSVDPRLSVRLALTPALALKGTVGIYHQLPTPQFLDKEFGNPNLALIWADQYELGVERRFTRDLNLTATGFYVRRHDLPATSVEHWSSTGRARSYGLEVLLRHEITQHFYGWIAYTLSRSEDAGPLAEAVPTGQMGLTRNDFAWHPGPFDQTHNLIVVASYKLRSWELGARYRYVTGTPTTPIQSSFYDTDFNAYTPLNGPVNSTRLPAFSQLDVRLERTWVFNYWSFGAYIDCQNVFNAQNPEGFTYDYRFQASAAIRGIPILPVLGLRGRF
jgi:TonB family protein